MYGTVFYKPEEKLYSGMKYGTKSGDTHHDTAVFLNMPVVVLPHFKLEP
jgi:hypothetical protein